jgi:lipoprotein-releasing system ATP-binding protein
MNDTAINGSVLELRDIRRSFVQGDGKLDVLCGCALRVDAGETVALMGPSGAGKSTLLHIAGLLEAPDSGSVVIAGNDIAARDDATRTALRRDKIGFVYQFHHLLPEFSARENIILPQMIAGVARDKAGRRADELLELVELTARSSHRPARLSGGEQQRIALARALANKPQLLIADEPTGNLDPHTAEHVFALLGKLVKTQGLGLLMATHNLDLAKKMDRVLVLSEGKAVSGELRH